MVVITGDRSGSENSWAVFSRIVLILIICMYYLKKTKERETRV